MTAQVSSAVFKHPHEILPVAPFVRPQNTVRRYFLTALETALIFELADEFLKKCHDCPFLRHYLPRLITPDSRYMILQYRTLMFRFIKGRRNTNDRYKSTG